MKNHFRTLLSFSRKELNGMLVLFGLLLLLILSQPLTDRLVRKPEADFSGFEREMELLAISASDTIRPGRKNARATGNAFPAARTDFPPAQTDNAKQVLFPFDPNTASREDLLKLGLQERVANTFLNYRKAGGGFYNKEDLGKIYGLGQPMYERLLPWVRIESRQAEAGKQPERWNTPATGNLQTTRNSPERESSPEAEPSSGKRALSGNTARSKAFPGSPEPARHYPVIDINTADSTALLPLPGIGPVLSARIVKYRERLGGFHSTGQLLEVYGLDTASYRKFKPRLRVDTSLLRKIDLNTAGYPELERLPYWSSVQINTVLNYRGQRGGFSQLSELYNIRALEEHIIQKVMPYLSLE